MAFIGSDVKEVTVNNPVSGSFSFTCKANEGSNIDLGGIRTSDDKQGISADGRRISIKGQNCSEFVLPPVAWDKLGKDELKLLTALPSVMQGSTVVVSFLDGSIFRMLNGEPVGDISADGQAATFPITFQGNAGAKQI